VSNRLREVSPNLDLRQLGFRSFRDFALAAEAQKAVQVTLSKTKDLRLSPYVEDSAETELKFDTPAEACESYRTILLSGRKAPIIPWPERQKLVEHLWEVLARETDGQTEGEMSSELIRFARQQTMGLPDRAIQKLLHTLNVAECFTDGGEARRFREPSQIRLRAGCALESALDAMHEVYVRGILASRPQTPLDERGLALLLFGEEGRRPVSALRALLKRVAPPAAGKKHVRLVVSGDPYEAPNQSDFVVGVGVAEAGRIRWLGEQVIAAGTPPDPGNWRTVDYELPAAIAGPVGIVIKVAYGGAVAGMNEEAFLDEIGIMED